MNLIGGDCIRKAGMRVLFTLRAHRSSSGGISLAVTVRALTVVGHLIMLA